MNSVAEEYTLHDNQIEKKKTTKSNTAASVSTNGGRQGRRREGKQKSLADDNRHPDKNSQHTCTNTLLNVFSRQDTRKQHVRLLSLSASLSNKQCDDHTFKHAYTVDCNSLSITRSLTLCKNFGLLCGTCGKTRLCVPSATHHHSLEKVPRRERLWTFLGAPSESRWAGTHSRTTRGGASPDHRCRLLLRAKRKPRLADDGKSERPAATQCRSEHITSSQRLFATATPSPSPLRVTVSLILKQVKVVMVFVQCRFHSTPAAEA